MNATMLVKHKMNALADADTFSKIEKDLQQDEELNLLADESDAEDLELAQEDEEDAEWDDDELAQTSDDLKLLAELNSGYEEMEQSSALAQVDGWFSFA